jgi:hypothetical protein
MSNTYRSLEDGVSKSLDELGFSHVREFRVPVETRKIDAILDFYISFPVRAFLEVKQGKHPQLLERTVTYFRKIYYCFNRAVVPILVTSFPLSDNEKMLFQDLPVHFITYEADDENCGRKIATAIKNKVFDNVYPYNLFPKLYEKFEQKDDFLLEIRSGEFASSVGILKDLLISLRPIMFIEQFQTLKDEIAAVHAELETNHFTTGALRVGRTLEFVVYTIATSWGVSVDRSTVKLIEDLRNSVKEFETVLIDYLESEDDVKKNFKKKVKNSSHNLISKINSIGYEMDEEHSLEETNVPVNIQAILSSAKKKFGRDEDIREEFDQLKKDGLVKKILDYRNIAAHADTSGERREVSKKDLEEAIQVLGKVLFRLMNISAHVSNITNTNVD